MRTVSPGASTPSTPSRPSTRRRGVRSREIRDRESAAAAKAENGFDAAWQLLVGRPLRRSQASKEQITPVEGLSALSLDALTSVAYGPEAIIVVLAVAGAGALHLVLPITIVIIVLLAILVFSYRQVIDAYPQGGGAYAVSRGNLGKNASLVAAASLVVDYTLTVAVSISAGVEALTSAFPSLTGASVPTLPRDPGTRRDSQPARSRKRSKGILTPHHGLHRRGVRNNRYRDDSPSRSQCETTGRLAPSHSHAASGRDSPRPKGLFSRLQCTHRRRGDRERCSTVQRAEAW